MFWDWDSIRIWIALLLEILILQWYFDFERRCESEMAMQRFMAEHEEKIKYMCTELCNSINKEFDDLLEVREMYNNMLPYINREKRRKVERYMKKHPGLTFVQAYNKMYHTDYDEPDSLRSETTCDLSNNRITGTEK